MFQILTKLVCIHFSQLVSSIIPVFAITMSTRSHSVMALTRSSRNRKNSILSYTVFRH